MKKEDAEEFTQSLGKVVGGAIGLIEYADRQGIPKALGMKLPEWVDKYLGGYAKLGREERLKKIAEYKDEGLSNRKIAERLGVDPQTVANDRNAENSAPDRTSSKSNQGVEEKGAENSATHTASKAARTRTTNEEFGRRTFNQPTEFLLTGDPVRLGDFYELSAELKDGDVDLIFTDPPYDDESISLFGRMGEVAARVLKPGGSLVTYLGHMQLLEAGRLLSQHLRYWHPLCCLHAGPLARMTEFGVIETFKPMLWFVKGTRSDKQTFIESAVTGSREKDHHEWQQAESEAAYFIERLANPKGLVVDFFAGGGTTIVAADRLGRRAVGYEINAKHHAKANKRIAEARGVVCQA